MSFALRSLRFAVVGVLTAVIHYGLLYLGVEGAGMGATIASSIGFVVSVIFNYSMHYSWTFADPHAQEKAPHGRTLTRYLVMIATGFAINGVVMFTGVHWLSLHYLLTQVLAFALVITWNFVMSNVWVFRQ